MKIKSVKKLENKSILSSFFALILLVTIMLFYYSDNKTIDKDNLTIKFSESEKTIKIAHLSDMHFPRISVNLDELINILIQEKVDIIAITGDIVDMHDNIETSGVYLFIEKLVKVAPVYYVSGNHEKRNIAKTEFYNFMAEKTVFLSNSESIININGKTISILGLDDNTIYSEKYYSSQSKTSDFKLIIAHRPEKYKSYSDGVNNSVLPNLVLTGHAHGGQFRAFQVGLVAPGQGLFPKYDSGLYTLDYGVKMFVSRGIGNSGIPIRINNKPHLPIISVVI